MANDQTATATTAPATRSKESSVYTQSKNFVFDFFVVMQENPEIAKQVKAALAKGNEKLYSIGETLFKNLPTGKRESLDPREALKQVKARLAEIMTPGKDGKSFIQTVEGLDEARTLLNKQAKLEIDLGLRKPKRSKKEQALPANPANTVTV